MHDNPPAFPNTGAYGHTGDYLPEGGMTLRDYFAVHADQPGVSEIVSMAGHTTDGFWVTFADDRERLNFNDWWNTLSLVERLGLSARVRFAMADAMLAARKEQPNG